MFSVGWNPVFDSWNVQHSSAVMYMSVMSVNTDWMIPEVYGNYARSHIEK